jgi:hypothetical protein
MNTPTVGFSRLTAAACATAITIVGAWAFVSATASGERDPFHFAAVMAANAQVARTAQLQARNAAPTCRTEPLNSGGPVSRPAPVCQNS